MGHWEMQRGEFVVPKARWAAFKKVVREAYNADQNARLETALAVHARTFAKAGKAGPGLTVEGLRQELRRSLHKGCDDLSVAWGMLKTGRWPDHGTPLTRKDVPKPKRADFPLATNRTNSFRGDQCDLSFDDGTRTVRWGVDQNKGTIDAAWGSALGRAFRAALNGTEWTRGTGGEIETVHESRDDWSPEQPFVASGDTYGPLGRHGTGRTRHSTPSRAYGGSYVGW